jgi:hypothetical protein
MLMPSLRRTPLGQERDLPAKLIPEHSFDPGSDVIDHRFDASSKGSLSLIFMVHT